MENKNEEQVESVLTFINNQLEKALVVNTFGVKSLRLTDYLALLYIGCIFLWCVKLVLNFCKSLCNNGPILNSTFRKLRKASYQNDTSAILYLLPHDPSLINHKMDKYGYTPFLRACYNGNAEVVKAMLQLGADIHAETTRKENAFYLAISNHIKNMASKDCSCIHALSYTAVDMNKPNVNGIRPIQLAAMFGHFRLIYWLRDKGVNMNVHPSIDALSRSNGFPQMERVTRLASLDQTID